MLFCLGSSVDFLHMDGSRAVSKGSLSSSCAFEKYSIYYSQSTMYSVIRRLHTPSFKLPISNKIPAFRSSSRNMAHKPSVNA